MKNTLNLANATINSGFQQGIAASCLPGVQVDSVNYFPIKTQFTQPAWNLQCDTNVLWNSVFREQ